MLDEIERSLHDALCVVKRTLESNMVQLIATVPYWLPLDEYMNIMMLS